MYIVAFEKNYEKGTILYLPSDISLDFYLKLDEIAFLAFDDQCTSANPIYPLIEELKQILIDAYWGNI